MEELIAIMHDMNDLMGSLQKSPQELQELAAKVMDAVDLDKNGVIDMKEFTFGFLAQTLMKDFAL